MRTENSRDLKSQNKNVNRQVQVQIAQTMNKLEISQSLQMISICQLSGHQSLTIKSQKRILKNLFKRMLETDK